MTIAASLDEPLLAELHAYWAGRRGERVAPARSDIDPVDIPHLLPHIALAEVVMPEDAAAGNTVPRIRYRLAGTEIEARFGTPLTNRFLDELKQGEYLAYIQSLYRRLIEEPAPIYSEGSFAAGDGNRLLAKRLMLPLSDDGKTVNMVLSGVVYRDSDPHRRATVLPVQGRFSAPEGEAG